MKEGDRITSINNFLSNYPAYKTMVSVIETEIADIDRELGDLAEDFNGVLSDEECKRIEQLIASKTELDTSWLYYNELLDNIRYIFDSIKSLRLRAAARLHYIDGMTWGDAAKVVGYSEAEGNSIDLEVTQLVNRIVGEHKGQGER